MLIFKCDGCGKQTEAPSGNKPTEWFQRTDNKTGIEMHACDRKCIELAAIKLGCPNSILPL